MIRNMPFFTFYNLWDQTCQSLPKIKIVVRKILLRRKTACAAALSYPIESMESDCVPTLLVEVTGFAC